MFLINNERLVEVRVGYLGKIRALVQRIMEKGSMTQSWLLYLK